MRSTTRCSAARWRFISPRRPIRRAQSPIAPIWHDSIDLARRFGFLVFSDECYSEIYSELPPPGMLELAGPDFANVVVFQSLSKRSNLPGLRVGFVAGDQRFLARFIELRNIAAPQVPVPAQEVAIAAYGDEAHVKENRRLYTAKFDLADQIVGDRYGYRRPAGGFYLWLDVGAHGGDEAATVALWREAGLRVIPGRYLARDQARRQQSRRTATSASPWCTTRRPRPRRCIASSRCSGERGGMYALRRTLDDAGFLSDEFRGLIGRRVRELGGCILIALAVLAGLALATWSVQDPSLSHATSARVRNLLGLPGAVTADLLMQLLGLGALALVLPIAALGMAPRIASADRPRAPGGWRRGSSAIPLTAAFVSCLPTESQWALPTGLGGVIGDAMLRLPMSVLGGPLAGTSRIVVAVFTGAAGLLALAFACGLRGARSRSCGGGARRRADWAVRGPRLRLPGAPLSRPAQPQGAGPAPCGVVA